MYILPCIGFWSLCCSMHTLCNKFASVEVWGLLCKSLKHNHQKIYANNYDDDDDTEENFGQER